MKIKHDFVTNSSSSSFIILKKYLNGEQIDQIRNCEEVAKKLGMDYIEYSNDWNIRDFGEAIHGYTFMDNFNMHGFLEKIGVDMEKVEWRD